jgi:hypothetical protein
MEIKRMIFNKNAKNFYLLFLSILLCCSNGRAGNSAGVIPYYEDQYGSINFLLGSEDNNLNHPKFCDFGGGAKAEDGGNNVKTAVREMTQETLSLLFYIDKWHNSSTRNLKNYNPILGQKESKKLLENMLQNEGYLHSSYKKNGHYHIMYFVNITKYVNMVDGMHKIVKFLRDIRSNFATRNFFYKGSQIHKRCKREFLEKKDFKWYTQSELLAMVKGGKYSYQLRKCFKNHLLATLTSQLKITGGPRLRELLFTEW